MRKEKIDEFLEAFITHQEKVVEFLGVSFEEIKKFSEEQYEELLRKIMIDIENGDYEYFRDKLKECDDDYKYLILYLISLSSKDENKIELIEKRDEYDLDEEMIADLIYKVEDVNFKKKCINKREEYNLSSIYIINIIKSINDPKYTEECIKNGKKYGLESSHIESYIEKK